MVDYTTAGGIWLLHHVHSCLVSQVGAMEERMAAREQEHARFKVRRERVGELGADRIVLDGPPVGFA